jgi:hypothetical protein
MAADADAPPTNPHLDAFGAEGEPEGYPNFQPMVASRDEYERMYRRSVDDPDGFWGELAEEFDWKTKVRAVGNGVHGATHHAAACRWTNSRLPPPLCPHAPERRAPPPPKKTNKQTKQTNKTNPRLLHA